MGWGHLTRPRVVRIGLAAGTTAALVGLSAGPGAAATTVAEGRATAVQVTIGGQTKDSGSYQATNDGSGEQTSGSNRPMVTVLGGQSLLTAGTLAQDATTRVSDGKGHSAACAGLAGTGATVVSAGDSRTCLTPGQAVTLNGGSLDLGNITLVQSDLLQGLDTQIQQAIAPVLAQALPQLQSGLNTALAQLGLGLNLGFGAVQSSCTADPGQTAGSAHLAGAGASVTVGGQQVNLVNLPVDPPPNTHVVTNLGSVADAVEKALATELRTAAANQLPGPLATALGPLQALLTQLGLTPDSIENTVLNNGLDSIGQQLAPLQQNVIDAVLNVQTHPTPDSIQVTALDLHLLPAAAQFGVNAFELSVGTSECSGGRVAATPSPTPSPKPHVHARAVPTSVPAGVDSAGPSDDGGIAMGGLLALAGLVMVGVGAVGAAWSAARRP